MKLLNIGCGAYYHPAWTNIDVAPVSPAVLSWDIKKGLPFKNDTFDAVYHSHVLEHLSPKDALAFLNEAVRVLKPKAVMRVVVPDLEKIARLYLEKLDAVHAHHPDAEEDYDWMMLELLDQTVRTESGGEMKHHLQRSDLKNRNFIISRLGKEASDIRDTGNNINRHSFFQKLHSVRWTVVLSWIRNEITSLTLAIVAGRRATAAFRQGLFRNSGEIHQWMYDGFSLERLLKKVGLIDIRACRADESRIPFFSRYQLDVIDGMIRKPDSLFMEALKP